MKAVRGVFYLETSGEPPFYKPINLYEHETGDIVNLDHPMGNLFV